MEALHARAEGGVLTLTLDTPGSDVNVFDLRAAEALTQAIEGLDGSIEVVVLASRKPGSFVNGVGLMMAGAAKGASDVARLTEPVRRAYRALRDARVPTIAAIRGNCFGCGVELALQCSHRIAVEDGPTCFYMTEIADYLFVPCFGATQDLPGIVGLDAAIRLVVHGERWSASDALRGGLVDRTVKPRGSDEPIARFVEDVRRGRVPSRRTMRVLEDADLDATRDRIARLPEAARIVSDEALSLLVRGARGAAAYDDEIEAAGRTVAREASKAAQGYFFVRQIAAQRERRRSKGPRVRSLVLAGLPHLRRELVRRAPLELAIVDAPAPRDEPDRLLLASSSGPGVDVVVSTEPSAPLREGGRPIAWAPMLGLGCAFVEIDPVMRAEVAGQLAIALHAAGFETAQTHPTSAFVTRRVADAMLDPIDRFLARGGAADEVSLTLRTLGFARSPRVVAIAIGREPMASDDPPRGAAPSAVLALAITSSLVAIASELLSAGEVDHPTTLDVIARHVIEFPLAERSLCRFGTIARAGTLLDHASEMEPLIDANVLTHLEAHVRRGRDHYC